jgi:DNA-binding MarR family transcriptional regulator
MMLIISSADDQHSGTLAWMSAGAKTGSQAARRLGYLFKHAGLLMSELNDAVLAPFGIVPRELGILIVIDSFEPASQQQVAERIGIDRTTMVAMLDSLEAKGLLSRRPDIDDRRRNVVELTPAGHDILSRAVAASDTAEAELLAPLSPEEAMQLRDLLARVVARKRAP